MRGHQLWHDSDYDVARFQRRVRRDLPPIESRPAIAQPSVPVVISRDFVSGCAEIDVPYDPFDPSMADVHPSASGMIP